MKSAMAAVILLLGISGFCFWNSRAMADYSAQRQEELQHTSCLVQQERWDEARQLLQESYQRWSRCQVYLRTVSTHAVLEEAEELYRRILAYGESESKTLLLAAVSHLDDQLQLLSDREALKLTNIF